MKIETPLKCILLLGLGCVFARADQPAAPAATTPPPAPVASFTDVQKLEEVGWVLAKRSVADLNLSPEEVAAVIKGFSVAMNGQPAPYDYAKIGGDIGPLFQKKKAAYVAAQKQKNAGQTSVFLAKLKENKNVVETPTGLRYEIVKPGEGSYPKSTDTVKVNYTGTLIDGTIFDSSSSHGRPAEFPLMSVIAGWTEGIQKINKGGEIRLYVPAKLAYGDVGQGTIPPGALLIFDVELLEFRPTNAPAPTPGAPAKR